MQRVVYSLELKNRVRSGQNQAQVKNTADDGVHDAGGGVDLVERGLKLVGLGNLLGLLERVFVVYPA